MGEKNSGERKLSKLNTKQEMLDAYNTNAINSWQKINL